MFFVFSNLPIFCADAPRASFVATQSSTGLSTLRCDFAAIVTEVSVTPRLSFARVLPVQGAITSKSHIFFGPIGSVSTAVVSTLFPVISFARLTISLALPKRVSVDEALPDMIGITSYPSSISSLICSNAFVKVQKEPHIANPMVAFVTNLPPQSFGIRLF